MVTPQEMHLHINGYKKSEQMGAFYPVIRHEPKVKLTSVEKNEIKKAKSNHKSARLS